MYMLDMLINLITIPTALFGGLVMMIFSFIMEIITTITGILSVIATLGVFLLYGLVNVESDKLTDWLNNRFPRYW